MCALFRRRYKSTFVFSEEDQNRVANAIAKAEMTTSGEIRVFVEKRCPQLTPIDRAKELFFKLEMDETKYRNGVIVYLATQDKVVAIYGDEGTYTKTGGQQFWEDELAAMIEFLKKNEIVEGIEQVVHDLGYTLAEYFPYEEGLARNELPDEIVFGQGYD